MKKIDLFTRLLESHRAVIFDFDNVIVDSEPYHCESYTRVFARRGHTIDRREYWLEWTSRGGGAEGEIRRYNLAMNPDEIRAEKDPLYTEFCRSGAIKLFPEAVRAIGALRGMGFSLAIASGSYESDIRAILSASGIESLFPVIVGKDGIKRYKPHPDTYLIASEKLRIPPGECLAIEDAEKGVRSAHAAGMKVILIETPITKELRLGGADLAFESLAEFAEALEGVAARRGR